MLVCTPHLCMCTWMKACMLTANECVLSLSLSHFVCACYENVKSIEVQQQRITEIRQAIESKRGNRKNVNSETSQARAQLVQVRSEFKRELEIKQNIRTKLQAADLARDTLRNELKAMKDKLNFVKVNDIEAEMKRIEERMAHTTLSLDEEKRLVSQLASLNKSRDVVKGFGARQEQLSLDEENRKEILDKLKAQDAVLNEIKQREGVLQQQMQVAKTKEESVTGDVPQLIAERESCIANIKGIRGEIRTLRDAFRELENAYYSREREMRDIIKKEREDKKQQYLEEKKKRDEERKLRALENAPPPYYAEITICEQLVAYLTKFTAPTTTDDAAATAEVSTSASASADAAGLVLKKRTEDECDVDQMFSGMGGKTGKKKKKQGAKKKKGGDQGGSPTTTKLPHSIETYSSFSTIGVTVPVYVADAQAALDAISTKRAEYDELAKVEAEKRKAKLEKAANGEADEEEADAEASGADDAKADEDAAPATDDADAATTEPAEGKTDGDEKSADDADGKMDADGE